MGANVLRQDDSYSFQVINKTVDTVIPALIQVTTGHWSLKNIFPLKSHHLSMQNRNMVFSKFSPAKIWVYYTGQSNSKIASLFLATISSAENYCDFGNCSESILEYNF